MSDTELLDAWRSGDEASGQALFKHHFSSLYRFFRNKVGDDCDDLIQRTFLAALKGIDGFRGHSSFRTYLFVIARHELYRYLRGRHRDQERFDPEHETLEALAPSPSSDAARAELETIVLEALRRISVDMQVALELHYWEDLTTRELAETLEVPESTVKSRIQRGRGALDKEIRRALRRAGLVGDDAAIEAALGLSP